jgi:hypothetical protein
MAYSLMKGLLVMRLFASDKSIPTPDTTSNQHNSGNRVTQTTAGLKIN